ncbi:MAG: ABC transporter ATP-binding protein [Burkholderiaceae bacterium]
MKAHRSAFLECRELSFARIDSAPPILQDFQLQVGEGEFVCLLGPSGCGKTTLLNLLAGFLQPTSGEALLDGTPIRSASRDRGVIFQSDDALFGWLTASENVGFGLKMQGMSKSEWQSKADYYLALVGLHGHENKFPEELSGGMKQRVQIARALANEPKILLMDEPFAALDAQTRAMMQAELVRIWSETGKTIVFITHDIGEAVVLADRIGVMTAGPASRLKAMIEVTVPRPRLQTSIEYFEYTQRCHALIQEEVAGAMAGAMAAATAPRSGGAPVVRLAAVGAARASGREAP